METPPPFSFFGGAIFSKKEKIEKYFNIGSNVKMSATLLKKVDDIVEKFFVIVKEKYNNVDVDVLRTLWTQNAPATKTTSKKPVPSSTASDSDEEIPTLKKAGATSCKCSYVPKRGKNSGVQCEKKASAGSKFCSAHKKSEGSTEEKKTLPTFSPSSSATKISSTKSVPTIEEHPTLHVYYHKESGLAMKSAQQHYVNGIVREGKVQLLDDTDVQTIKRYGFIFLIEGVKNPRKWDKDSNLKVLTPTPSVAEEDSSFDKKPPTRLSELSDTSSDEDEKAIERAPVRGSSLKNPPPKLETSSDEEEAVSKKQPPKKTPAPTGKKMTPVDDSSEEEKLPPPKKTPAPAGKKDSLKPTMVKKDTPSKTEEKKGVAVDDSPKSAVAKKNTPSKTEVKKDIPSKTDTPDGDSDEEDDEKTKKVLGLNSEPESDNDSDDDEILSSLSDSEAE